MLDDESDMELFREPSIGQKKQSFGQIGTDPFQQLSGVVTKLKTQKNNP